VSNSSDPERGGQQPDERAREGQPDGGSAAPPGGPDWDAAPAQQAQPPAQQAQPPAEQAQPPAQQEQPPPAQQEQPPPAQQEQPPPAQPPPGQYQPGQYQPGQYPQGGPYGQPGEYGQPGQYGGPYGQPGQYQVPSHGQPYGDRGGYVYAPYGSYPAGMPEEDTPKVGRPGIMVLALVLLIISALPSIAAGLLVVLSPGQLVQLAGTPEQLDQLRAAGVDPESVIAFGGAIALGLALLYVLFAVLAFAGRNWARIVVAIMTAGFALMTFATGVTGLQSAELLFLVLMVGASIVGTVILFLPGPSSWFGAHRR
jgi:hypothetical protein